MGVDGWRLDAAYAVPAEFWSSVIPAVRERFADAWFLGEMIHGDYAGYAATAGLDSITQYELWQAMWSSIENHNFYELEHTLGRHAELCERIVPFTFLDNHDTSRVASQIGDRRHWGHAIALLLFLPGIPCLYYGDELGLIGVKEQRLGGDDAIRPTMPERPDQVEGTNAGVLELYRRLIAFRRRTPWLTDARIVTSDVSNTYLQITATATGHRRGRAAADPGAEPGRPGGRDPRGGRGDRDQSPRPAAPRGRARLGDRPQLRPADPMGTRRAEPSRLGGESDGRVRPGDRQPQGFGIAGRVVPDLPRRADRRAAAVGDPAVHLVVEREDVREVRLPTLGEALGHVPSGQPVAPHVGRHPPAGVGPEQLVDR